MTTTDVEGFVLRGGEGWRSPWSAYRYPVHRVDHPKLGFAPGPYVRRYESLPFRALA